MKKRVKRKAKRLPRFKTHEEFIRFVETHDMTDYANEFEPIDEMITLSPKLAKSIRERTKKKLLSIRMEQWQIDRAKEIAKKKGMPYQELMREWITQGIREEHQHRRRKAQ